MKIGLISDTHGNVARTTEAADIFRQAGVKAVLHCGDIGNYEVLAQLVELDVTVYAVLGNCDVYVSDWKYFPTNAGVQLLGRFGEVELGGKKIALLHGDDERTLLRSARSGDYDYVLSGHSHEPHDVMQGKTRCINPGAISRSTPPTCAVLDLSINQLKVVELGDED